MADETNPYAQYATQGSDNPYAQWGTAQPQSASPSWGEVALGAAENAPGSLYNMGAGIYQAARHPFDTIYNVADVAVGAGEKLADKLGISPNPTGPETASEQKINALRDYYVGRYGGIDKFKTSLQKDPAGVLADASMVLGGAGAAMRAVPELETAANVASKASQLTNPIALATKPISATARAAGRLGTNIVGDLGTFTGSTPLTLAYDAGRSGGQLAKTFLDNMQGNVPVEDVVQSAKDALFQLKREKNAEYQAGMADISAQTAKQQAENKSAQMQYNARAEDTGIPGKENPEAILKFDPIDEAFTKNAGMKNFQGKDIGKSTAQVREEISNEISDWKNSDPAAFHTPMGFDALKQSLYDIASKYPIGSPSNLFAQNMARAVKAEIVQQAPRYAKVMSDYEDASDTIRQIESELSLNSKANVGTSLRKLQSIMRNNVQTNYTYRKGLADTLSAAGQPTLQYQLAGQALNKWSPRGLGAAVAAADIFSALKWGNYSRLAALPLMSPRLMGNVAYGLGATARAANAPFSALGRTPVVSRLAPYVPGGPTAANILYQSQAPNRALYSQLGIQ